TERPSKCSTNSPALRFGIESTRYGKQGLEDEVFTRILDELCLVERVKWENTPSGFTHKDIVPWKFRRRLSSIYRPIMQLNISRNSVYLIAPSFIREGYVYRVTRAYWAEFDDSHFKTDEMKYWIGHKRNIDGHDFNSEVSNMLASSGWSCKTEVEMPELGIETSGKNFGDIDVLAWNTTENRIAVIECKNLMFPKTTGEVARQVQEFVGICDDKGDPDRLKKHLDRMELLNENRSFVEKFVSIKCDNIESVLVFKNPVPISFNESDGLSKVRVVYFDALNVF
ncbi:MAG: hypothetical protein JKX85_01070, partial [Phycisphaeraceae bacterium]|nr:hypothetical protein [Phycisphaeraceae bacterium]